MATTSELTAQAPIPASDKTLSVGNLAPLRIREVPPFVGIWAAMGPGVIWASMAQGSGELIWWPYLTAKYGAAFLGILLPACLIQIWVNHEIARYTITTGETFFTGLMRFNKWFAFFMWIMLVVAYLWFGGMVSSGATALFELFRFPTGWDARSGSLFWAYLTIAVFVFGLLFSKVVYELIEKFMTAVVVVTVLGLLVSILNPAVLATAGSFLGAYLNPLAIFANGLPRTWDPQDADTLLTGIAFAGMGGFYNAMYSYWIRDKGHAMGKYAGRITSPITGKAESIPTTGFAFQDTPENQKNYRDWMRYIKFENVYGVAINALTVMMMCWLAWAILMPKGQVPSGWQITVVQAQFFEAAMGPVGRVLFLIVGAAFLSDTYLGVADAASRMHADFICHFFPGARRWSQRTWYYVCVGILTLISAVTIQLAQPGELILLTGIFSFLAMAIYMPVLIYLNYKIIPGKFPAWVKPARVTFWIATLITAFYIVFSIIYILFRVFGVRIIF